MDYFKSNINFLRNRLGKTQDQLATDLGFSSRSRIAGYENGQSKPSFDDLMQIAAFFNVSLSDIVQTDLSKANQIGEPPITYQKNTSKNTQINPLPLIPIDAMAGFAAGDFSVSQIDIDTYVVPEFRNKADFLIRISGTSMSPKYYHGDIIACKKIPAITFFQWGKVYILDTVQGALCKRVMASEVAGHVKLVSENAAIYPAFDLNVKEIRSLAIVVGVIRIE